MHQAGLQVDLVPAQRDELRDPQPMPIGQEDERPIARTVAAHLARGLQELLDFIRGEILTPAAGGVGEAGRGRLRPGVPADLVPEGFLVPPRRGTFPFTSVGGALAAAVFLGD